MPEEAIHGAQKDFPNPANKIQRQVCAPTLFLYGSEWEDTSENSSSSQLPWRYQGNILHRQAPLIDQQGKIMSSMYKEQENILQRVARLEQIYIKQLQCNSIKREQAKATGIQKEHKKKHVSANLCQAAAAVVRRQNHAKEGQQHPWKQLQSQQEFKCAREVHRPLGTQSHQNVAGCTNHAVTQIPKQ